jgi:DNA repair exonuclease SbcCD ATPase subunit
MGTEVPPTASAEEPPISVSESNRTLTAEVERCHQLLSIAKTREQSLHAAIMALQSSISQVGTSDQPGAGLHWLTEKSHALEVLIIRSEFPETRGQAIELYEKTIEELSAQLVNQKSIEETIDSLSQEVTDLRNQCDRLEAENRDLQEQVGDPFYILDEVSEIPTDLALASDTDDPLIDDLASLTLETQDVEEQLRAARIAREALEMELSHLKSDWTNQEICREVALLQQQLRDSQAHLSELTAFNSELQALLQEKEALIDDLSTRLREILGDCRNRIAGADLPETTCEVLMSERGVDPLSDESHSTSVVEGELSLHSGRLFVLEAELSTLRRELFCFTEQVKWKSDQIFLLDETISSQARAIAALKADVESKSRTILLLESERSKAACSVSLPQVVLETDYCRILPRRFRKNRGKVSHDCRLDSESAELYHVEV